MFNGIKMVSWLYSYLNLESTKTEALKATSWPSLYSYLNLESTKT